MKESKQTSPPITVLMSVFNGACWLDEAIQSVLTQTFNDFEFIIINDGSTDSSLEIIYRFAGVDSRIVVINKTNTGLADSLNHGIHLANGEWIARIDADDLCEPRRLEIQYSLAQSNSDLVLIGAGLTVTNDLSQRFKMYKYPTEHQQLVDRLLKCTSFFAHSSAFYRTQIVKKLGGYRLRIKRAQDFDLWLRLSESGKIACVPDPLVCVRKHAEQISHDEGGRRQIVDSRVALVSYFLRQKGLLDPVDVNNDDDSFAAFRQFIEEGVEQGDLIEYQLFINQIKAKFSNPSLSGVLAFIALSGGSPHFVFRYIQQAIFGERLPQRLANEWIIHKGLLCAE